MSEKTKMINGELYVANEASLVAQRAAAKQQCHGYNQLAYQDPQQQKVILQALLGTSNQDTYFEAPFFCDYGYNIHVGKGFYANHNCIMLDCAPITIGDHVFIGPNTGLYTAGHPIDKEIRKQDLEYAYPITIGNDVWIGGNVAILPGVHIGDNVIIGAGSVVTKDIPSHCVAVGNPCKKVRALEK